MTGRRDGKKMVKSVDPLDRAALDIFGCATSLLSLGFNIITFVFQVLIDYGQIVWF